MAVPNIFGSATAAIPLSQLDTNFATPVTIGNTAVQLGNTVTSFGNVTLTNVTISSGNVTITGANVSGTANVSTLIVTGNQTSLGNVAITGNISANIATFGAGSNTAPSITTTGDTNTGIYFPGADRVGFATGGSQRGEFDASGNFQFNSGYGSVATAYGCRAWVNFNGLGTVAIRASGNVSSITDNGTGDYTVNFTTAMPDANYAANCSTVYYSLTRESVTFFNGTPSTTAIRLVTGYTYTSPGAIDNAYLYVAIFR